MTTSVNLATAKDLALTYMKAGLVPMTKSSPGIGKSSIMQQIADENDLQLIDIRLAQCDPTDLNGFPSPDLAKGKARYLPLDIFPLAGEPLPTGKKGFLLHMDEFNSADRSVQKASYKVVLDHAIGNFPLHPKCAKACSGNLATDNAIVEELSSALQSRLAHISVHSDHTCWLPWASLNNIDHRICSFINWKPDLLNTFDPEKVAVNDTYSCERTWEFASRVLQSLPIDDKNITLALSGVLGEGVAREFLGYVRVFADLPTIDQIIKNPNSTDLPDNASTRYALSGSLGTHANANNIDPLLTYTRRLPVEFQVVTLRDIVRRSKDLLQSQPIQDWINETKTDLF